jgi:hypothetical protein
MIGVLAIAAVSAQQSSQPSLAEVARQAEAAKVSTAKAKKTYTNADLSQDNRGEPAPAPAAPPPGFMSSSLGKPVSADEIIARSEETVDQASGKAQSEEHWRGRAESLRAQIEKLQTRMTALTKPNEARDASPGARARNDAEVAKVQQGLNALLKQRETLEESARVAKIPPEWIQP